MPVDNASLFIAMRLIDLTVVAEGVETEEQLNILRSGDCGLYQGFYYSAPLSYDDFVDFYNNQ